MKRRTPIRVLVRDVAYLRDAARFMDLPTLTVEQRDRIRHAFHAYWDSWVAPKLDDIAEHDPAIRRKKLGGEA